MPVLIDTSFLLALTFPRDANHQQARAALRELKETRLVPLPVLPELFYLASVRMNYMQAIRAFERVHSVAFKIETLTDADMARMRAIMYQYADNHFDFVDVSLMAIGERLNIADIYTFDRRDFYSFVPSHRTNLRVLP